jgi:choline monooxygenase
VDAQNLFPPSWRAVALARPRPECVTYPLFPIEGTMMFIGYSKHDHVLRPDQYVSESQYREELRTIFWPTWHPVATTYDLAKPGDFFTFNLLEHPVLLRNMGGELRAFLNVCPHRHCELTSVARGSSPELRCQYHGWEFNDAGRTGKIPDAKSFRPFDRENACLKQFRVATYGALVFVSLAEDGPTLQEYFGPLYEEWLHSFNGRYRYAQYWEGECACNWKVPMDNALEVYHVPLIHSWLGTQQTPEEKCTHVLNDRYNKFSVRVDGNFPRFDRAFAALIRWLGGEYRGTYEAHAIHPNVILTASDAGRWALVVYPLSPTHCQFRMYAFPLRNNRGGMLGAIAARSLRAVSIHVAKRIYREDASIYAAIQRGLNVSPHRGVLGIREERLIAFQEFVAKRCPGAAKGPNA